MLQEISAEEIEYAEKILFGGEGHFDQERIDFIKCLETVDLQAVPGSGKTTVLLAKLLIIEKRLPLNGGGGILVISHTNVAIEEIKNRISVFCPKLFNYPNFVGTIQSFVNQFLAIPFYEEHFKKKLLRIDNEIYYEELARSLRYCLKKESRDVYKKVLHINRVNPDLICSYRFELINKKVCLVNKLNGKKLELFKPKGNTKKENYSDYSDAEKSEIIKYLTAIKSECLGHGTLHFDDAYFLATLYIQQKHQLIRFLRLRFPFVFVDEMQDMERHQHDLLEAIFHDAGAQNCYQRIGDINQCIFNENTRSTENVWQERIDFLTIAGSHRLSASVARIVQNFGAKRHVPITALNNRTNIKPHILMFQKGSAAKVIAAFGDLVIELQKKSLLPKDSKNSIKIIGWNGKEPESGKLRIRDYFKGYQNSTPHQRLDFDNLYSYLAHFDKENKSFQCIKKNILNAFLRVLRFEKITYNENYFTRQTLINYLKDYGSDFYNEFLDCLYFACINSIRGEIKKAHEKLSQFIPLLVDQVFNAKLSEESIVFIEGNISEDILEVVNENTNEIKYKTLILKVGTVHSVKGETHLATLYLDTCYFNHESQKSINQLMGKHAHLEKLSRTQESAKMMYVGFSRATHLLCYAVQEDCLKCQEEDLRREGWEISRI